jgi:hypothetical protein
MGLGWSEYKQLSKEAKEEYNFRFKDEDWIMFGLKSYIGMMCLMLLIALFAQTSFNPKPFLDSVKSLSIVLLCMFAVDIIYYFATWLNLDIWKRKHLKVVRK